MKKLFTILILVMMAQPIAGPARADNDFLEKILGTIKNKLQQVTIFSKQVKAERSRISAARQAAENPAGLLEGVGKGKQNESKFKELIKSPDFIKTKGSGENAEPNQKESAEAAGKTFTPEYGHGNDTAISKQKDEEVQVLQRDNISNLYSVAYVMRHDLLDEEDEENVEMDQEDKIIQSTTDKALSVTRRLTRISTLEMMIMEFKTSQKLKTFKVFGKPEDKETGGDNDGETE